MAHIYVGVCEIPRSFQLFLCISVRSRHRRGAFGAAVLALGLFEGAYMAELFRAGLQSVPQAQWEAGISLGLGV